MNVVDVLNISKKYGKNTILNNVSLALKKNEYFALVGNNGSGKTTLLRIVSGLVTPTEGKVFIMGHNSSNLKHLSNLIGVVHQYTGLPEYMKVKEFFRIEIKCRNLKPDLIQYAMRLGHLKCYENTMINTLSEGTKRKIVLIKAILHNPQILILDEPTVGIDPIMQQEIWEQLLILKTKGVSAIIATNNMNEAERLCDRVGFMHNGDIISEEIMKCNGSLKLKYSQLLSKQ
jgi:ABC-type multidrug transport system ATPase subunit